MHPEPSRARKTINALNNYLLMLANRHDFDVIPRFYNKRSYGKCLRWMQEMDLALGEIQMFSLIYLAGYEIRGAAF